MSNIRKIFIRDILALLKNPLALMIAGGLCIIPSLYAWFNIYSNWDPYGNTSGIQIAVATEDKGYQDSDGKLVNVSESVIESLKENKAISWTQVESKEAAEEGVNAGTYYAAVVFSEDFTECMYHGFLEELKRPEVTYYENEKKNAVAAKITDTAVSKLQNNINEQYISLVVSKLFDKEEQLAQDMDAEAVADTVEARLKRAKKILDQFSVTINSLEQANAKLSASMEGAQSDLAAIQNNLGNVQAKVQDVPDTSALADAINRKNSEAMQHVGNALDTLDEMKADMGEDLVQEKTRRYQTLASELGYTKDSVDTMINSLQTINLNTINSTEKVTITQLENLSAMLERMITRVNAAIASGDESIFAETDLALEEQLQMLQQSLQGTVSQSLSIVGSNLQAASEQVTAVTASINGDIDLVNTVLGNAVTAVDLTNTSFAGMQKEVSQVTVKLQQVSDIIAGIDETELAETFLSFMQGDPDAYGAFFAEPVSIETEAVYPVENYGSGVTPFYTTLAIWVGGVVLVSLIKVKTHTDDLVKPKAYELFLGRYLLFLLLSVIQTVIIVWGDLYILKIQCLYPNRFLAAALLAGVTFSLLIYSFTLSFGDVGKAVIVVIMVLQVAGSSGTYPIEILPEFYQKVYVFFPFPYAINAMREAICGMYENDYTLYLLRLSLFAAAALILGLVIRVPFMKINHFVERRMEDTEMM